MKKDISKIPEGHYCHFETKNEPCPYWEKRDDKLPQENGYCKFMEYGDWEDQEHMTLLWDMVKECGLNEWYNEDDVPPLTEEQKKELDKRLKQMKEWEEQGTLDEHLIPIEEVYEYIQKKYGNIKENKCYH